MSTPLAGAEALDALPILGPVHRSIVALDIEGSTRRTNLVKGELRRILYELLGAALLAAGIVHEHLEHLTDRGDGVLVLIRPHDDVPKTLILGRLIPVLTGLLAEYNASVPRHELQLRLRAVVHAGEVHHDGQGFYGDDLDVAFRLLDTPSIKKVLRETAASPLVLVISEEIFNSIVQQGYFEGQPYCPLGRVRVGNRYRRGWVHIPTPVYPDRQPNGQQPPALAMASLDGMP
jgi:hypothetical protein